MKVPVTRILIADDAELVRATLGHVLKRADNSWEVCGEAGNGNKAIQMAVELQPDLILLDMAMPELDGMSAARLIRAKLADIPILIYTFLSYPSLDEMAKQAGAQGVVQKGNLQALIAAIRRVLPVKTSEAFAGDSRDLSNSAANHLSSSSDADPEPEAA